jgi:putative oxidoreductase
MSKLNRNSFTRHEATVYAVLRIVAGAMFACHGMQIILGWFGGHKAAMPSQQWIGGVIELVGGILIALGLFTRLAAFLAAGTMAVAYFQFHWKLDTNNFRWLPIVNKGELAVLYCFVFLFICARGAGPLSIDQRRGRR